MMVNRDLVSGLWAILVGIFLFNSARVIINQVNNFENLSVENVMEMPAPVSPEMTVMKFVDTVLPLYRRTAFPVSMNRQLFGFLMLADLKKNLPREKWRETKVKDAMREINENYFVQLGSSVVTAREIMSIERRSERLV